MVLVIKNLPANAGDIRTRVRTQGQGDSLEEEMATHSSILDWKIPWTEQSDGLQSLGSQRVGHNWAHTHTKEPVNNCTHSVSKHKETTPMELILDQWEKNIGDNLSSSLLPEELSWYPVDHVTSSTTVLPNQSSLFSCQTMAHSVMHPPQLCFLHSLPHSPFLSLLPFWDLALHKTF